MKKRVSYMWAWVRRVAVAMQTPDGVAMSAGIFGFVLLVAGIALISIPAALIVSGALLMAWSAMFARSIAARGGNA